MYSVNEQSWSVSRATVAVVSVALKLRVEPASVQCDATLSLAPPVNPMPPVVELHQDSESCLPVQAMDAAYWTPLTVIQSSVSETLCTTVPAGLVRLPT